MSNVKNGSNAAESALSVCGHGLPFDGAERLAKFDGSGVLEDIVKHRRVAATNSILRDCH